MALPNPINPSLPSNAAPLFTDVNAARGGFWRTLCQQVWENFAFLDTISEVMAIGSGNLKTIILANPQTLRFYATTASTQTPSASHSWLIDVKWQDTSTRTCTVTATAEGSLLEYQIECDETVWGSWVNTKDQYGNATGVSIIQLNGTVGMPIVIGTTLKTLYGVATYMGQYWSDSPLGSVAANLIIEHIGDGTNGQEYCYVDGTDLRSWMRTLTSSTYTGWTALTDINGTPITATTGWAPCPTAVTFLSAAAAPNFTVTVPGDYRKYYSRGMKFQLQQSVALTSYWPMNNATPANDGTDSESLNAGTCANVTDTTAGLPFGGHAATFNGTSSKISFTTSASLKPTGDFTIGGWMKATGGAIVQIMFQSGSANPNFAGWRLHTAVTGVAYLWTGKNTGTTLGTDWTILSGVTNVCDGNWHYVEYTQRNNWGQLYVDGNLDASGYMFTPVYAATTYQRFGCLNSSGSDTLWFAGQLLDWFMITGSSGTTATGGYALDEQTIRNLYNATQAIGASAQTVTETYIISAAPTYAGGNTTLTLYGGTDFALQNAAISNPYYSVEKCPFGFNLNPDKWSVIVVSYLSGQQSSPVPLTWYNLASISIVAPIGVWSLRYRTPVRGYATNYVPVVNVSLSTSSSTVSDNELTETQYGYITVTGAAYTRAIYSAEKTVVLNSVTTYYLIEMSEVSLAVIVVNYGDTAVSGTVFKARSELL